MGDYRMFFFNNLLNSYGKPFKCLQRVITVTSANDAGEASEKAKRESERLEGVPNWKCHAQFLEVETGPSPNRAYPRLGRRAPPSTGVRNVGCNRYFRLAV
jgi:hypothetical protein